MKQKYLHLKTNNIYYKIGEAIDCTNNTDGRIMVIYKNKEGKVFVREKSEFERKFSLIESSHKERESLI